MSAVNDTEFQHTVFLLTGILGQEDVHVCISILFCLIYVTSLLGNSVIIFIIKTDPSLHEPMYIFICMLAITDLGLLISTMPTTLGIFLFSFREISHNACFAQMFFIHSFTFTESSVLLSMAFDRVVAICKPLTYASILTPPRIAMLGVASLLKSVFLIFPLPILLKQYQYCKANILYNSCCLHQEVMTLACSDIRVNIIYGLFVSVSSVWLDILLILVSYGIIFKTVLSLTSHTERFKALNTCISHVCVVLFSYTPVICLAVIYRFVKSSSPLVQNILGNLYLVISPLMNPIVYSLKTKTIRARIIRVFCQTMGLFITRLQRS